MTLVLKFGGAAVASSDRFGKIADLIVERSLEYERLVVVVSAMGNMTDELLELARKVHPMPPKREQDMLISVGERISMSLLAMALALKGKEAISLTGSQAGIITTGDHSEARIIEIRAHRLTKHLQLGKIVIVAGFQGVSGEGEITTLGRGGSDTSAVALAVALGAEGVEFYKDVPGMFAEDPKKNPTAEFFQKLDYDRALNITQRGAKVLQSRCIELAAKNGIVLHVRSFHQPNPGTLIGKRGLDLPKVYEAS